MPVALFIFETFILGWRWPILTQAPAIGQFTYAKKHLRVTSKVQRNFVHSDSNDDDPE